MVKSRKLIDADYSKKQPLITFRSNFTLKIREFIFALKRKNLCSRWINEAIREKYYREHKIKEKLDKTERRLNKK